LEQYSTDDHKVGGTAVMVLPSSRL
jgi:hypothetical protein